MTITVIPDNKIRIVLGGNLFPDSREAQKDVLELLSRFFIHNGGIVAMEIKASNNEVYFYSDARLDQWLDASIIVQNDVLMLHTNDTRFSWKIDESYSVEIWREQDVCGIFYKHYGEIFSRTVFMRGAR